MNLEFASDDVVYISWRSGSEEDVNKLRHTNEAIGAYVTARARIHLYCYLDHLGKNAMYCDMDSVLYIQPMGEPPLMETEDKLGDMTCELRSSETINEFVSGGQRTTRTESSIPGTIGKRLCVKSGA